MPKNKRNLFSDFDDSLKERATKKIIWKKILVLCKFFLSIRQT
jgi:hypothetical protein